MSSQMKALNDEVNVHKVESIKPKEKRHQNRTDVSDEKGMQQSTENAQLTGKHKENLLEEDLAVNWITSQLPISEQKLDDFKKGYNRGCRDANVKKVSAEWMGERTVYDAKINTAILDIARGNEDVL
ncbi:uncharacterized [Tachysurus ichikawai]